MVGPESARINPDNNNGVTGSFIDGALTGGGYLKNPEDDGDLIGRGGNIIDNNGSIGSDFG